MNKINLYIFDIDGVVADITHRLHYMKEKNYEKFYSDEEIAKDEKIAAGINLVNKLFKSADSFVVFMTGRPESTYSATRKWLYENEVKHCQAVFFRANGDYRPSPIVKVEKTKQVIAKVKELLDTASKDGVMDESELGNIYFIDDDPKNVQAVEEKYPDITGIVFTTKRMEKE